MNTKNEYNESVDWWFIYKTPAGTGSTDNEGNDYFYFDANATALKLSANKLNQPQGALYNTLNSAFTSKDQDLGYLIFNNELTYGSNNDTSRGLSKGILIFNKTEDTASLLVHSVAGYPHIGDCTLPEAAQKYGQSFLCISLAGYGAANAIARQMLMQQNPQVLVHNSKLPTNVRQEEPLSQLYYHQSAKLATKPSTLRFTSKAGIPFMLIAQSSEWHGNFWSELVGPQLNTNLDVTTLANNVNSNDQNDQTNVVPIQEINFESLGFTGYKWDHTRDQSRWAVAASEKNKPWICIGDIDRYNPQPSQSGGAVCFDEPTLWQALHAITSPPSVAQTQAPVAAPVAEPENTSVTAPDQTIEQQPQQAVVQNAPEPQEQYVVAETTTTQPQQDMVQQAVSQPETPVQEHPGQYIPQPDPSNADQHQQATDQSNYDTFYS